LITFFIGSFGFLLGIFLLLIRNRKIRKISYRNLFRKRTQTILIILGSMIGTAMITGSLGINDSMTLFLYSQIKNELGPVDETIYQMSSLPPFDKETGDQIIQNISSSYLIDGSLNVFYFKGAVSFNNSPIKNPLTDIAIKMIAFDFENLDFFDIKPSNSDRMIISEDLEKMIIERRHDEIFLSERADSFFDIGKQKIPITKYSVSKNIPKLNTVGEEIENTYTVLIDRDTFDEYFPKYKKLSNLILISNTGDWLTGRTLTNRVLSFLERYNLEQFNLKIETVKTNRISQAGNANIGYLFLFLSVFSIVAGIFLMISTYSMMAKEREMELGMLRALGFYRSDIMKMFFLEGIFYSFLSSTMGIIMGIYLTRFILSRITGFTLNLSNRFLNVIGTQFFSQAEIPEFEFYISNENIIISFLIGLLISLIIIFIYSRKISNFEIVNAIRGTNEIAVKQKGKKILRILIFLLLSILSIVNGLEYHDTLMIVLGLIVLSLVLLMKIEKAKYLIDFLLILLIMIAVIIDVDIFTQTQEAIILVFLKPLILLTGLSVLMMRSFETMKWLLSKKPFSKIVNPFTAKISFAYPAKEKGKTRLIIASYSLVIFIITIVTVIPHSQMIGIEQSKDTLFWGYDAFIPDFINANKSDIRELMENDFIEAAHEISASDIDTKGGKHRAFHIYSDFDFYETGGRWVSTSEYLTFESAVKQIQQDPNCYLIVSGREESVVNSGIDTIERIGDYEKLGIYFFSNITFFQGIVMLNEADSNDSKASKYHLIKIAGKTEGKFLQNKIKFRDYCESNGIFAITNDDIVEISELAIKGMIKILNGFLYFGMIVGIMGISITMFRAFFDRKRTIGMLKAIGFSKTNIFNSFILETSIIVITGLLIGVISGIISAEYINSIFSQLGAPGGESLYVPWTEILLISFSFYIASIFSVLIPSYNASKIEAAQALKTLE